MIIVAKTIRNKVKALGKQCNKSAITVLDSHVDKYIDAILAKQTARRITDKTIQL